MRMHGASRGTTSALPAFMASAWARIVTRWNFLEWFVISQVAFPALLYLPGTQAVRIPIRIAPFAISLAALAWWALHRTDKTAPHPAQPWLLAALAYLGFMLFHPTTNTLLAGLAQIMLYLAVMAPIFWAPALVRTPGQITRLLGIILVCNGINAVVGILQVYDPERWMPREFSSVVMGSDFGLDAVSYEGPDGRRIVRPPGLGDAPGAVAGPGMSAALLGMIFSLGSLAWWKKAWSLFFAFAGMAAIYLTQVRTSFLIVAGMVGLYLLLLARQGRVAKPLLMLALAGAIGMAALLLALQLGGQSITERLASLVEDDPATVYHTNRGVMVEHALTELLADYPFGAGLARWGMMRKYFGSEWNFDSPAIWAELQIPAWILDGGLVLLALYSMALLTTTIHQLHLPESMRSGEAGIWTPAVIALNGGVLALVFGFTPFTTQLGLQYWLLTGVLYGAASKLR